MAVWVFMTDAGLATAGQATTATGATAAVAGWLTASNILGLCGFLVALAGLAVTWHYKAREDRRLSERHALEIERLRQP